MRRTRHSRQRVPSAKPANPASRHRRALPCPARAARNSKASPAVRRSSSCAQAACRVLPGGPGGCAVPPTPVLALKVRPGKARRRLRAATRGRCAPARNARRRLPAAPRSRPSKASARRHSAGASRCRMPSRARRARPRPPSARRQTARSTTVGRLRCGWCASSGSRRM
jgi:hypothetical protein